MQRMEAGGLERPLDIVVRESPGFMTGRGVRVDHKLSDLLAGVRVEINQIAGRSPDHRWVRVTRESAERGIHAKYAATASELSSES